MLKLLMKLLLVAVIVFAAGTVTVYASDLFQDDFNGSSLDTNKWRTANCGAGDTYSVHDGVIEMTGGGTDTPPGLRVDSVGTTPSTFNLSGTVPVKIEFRAKYIGDPGNLDGSQWGFANLSNDFYYGQCVLFEYHWGLHPGAINAKLVDGSSMLWYPALDKSGYDFQKFNTYSIEYNPDDPNTYIFRINGMEKYKGVNTGSPLGALPVYFQVQNDLRYQIDWIKVTDTTDNTINGNITGTVYDNDRVTPVVGATVTTDTGVAATTDANGYYMLSVPAGEYTVTVSKTGYTSRSEKVSVAAYADVRQDLYFPYTNLDIVSGGTANADIVIGSSATWIENHAAEELKKYIYQMSGVNLSIVTSSTKSIRILIGRPETNSAINSLVTSGKLKVSTDYSGLDGFIIRALYDNGTKYLVLTGSKDRSSLYATYDLLESVLKCGFFQDGEYVPSLSTVTVPIMEKVSRPYFEDRKYNQGCAYYYTNIFWNLDDWKRELDWCAKKKQNIVMIPTADPTQNTTQDEQYHIQLYTDAHTYARQLGLRTIIPAGDGRTLEDVQNLIDTYGTDHLYTADINPEGTWQGAPEEITAQMIQAADDTYNFIKSIDSEGIWFCSGWSFFFDPVNWSYSNMQAFLNAIPDSFQLGECNSDSFPIYKKYNYYFGKDWGFGVLQNMFGRGQLMQGDMQLVADAANAVTNDPKAVKCKEFWINPESTQHNPLFYDFVARLSWDPRGINLVKFTDDFSIRRYGNSSNAKTMSYAWQILEGTAYRLNDKHNFSSGYPFASNLMLDEQFFAIELPERTDFAYMVGKALEKAISVKPSLSGNNLFNHDIVDITRQYIVEYYDTHMLMLLSAYKKGDYTLFYDSLNACRLARAAMERVLKSRPDYWVKYDLDKADEVYGNIHQLEFMGNSWLYSTPPGSSIETYVRHWWLRADFGYSDYLKTTTKYELYKLKYGPTAACLEDWLEQQFNNGRRDINDADTNFLNAQYQAIADNWANQPLPSYSPSGESMSDAASGAYNSLPSLSNGEFFPLQGFNVPVGDTTGYTLDVNTTDGWSIRDALGNPVSSEGMSISTGDGHLNMDCSVGNKYFCKDIASLNNISKYPILTFKWRMVWKHACFNIWIRWQDSNGNNKRNVVFFPSGSGSDSRWEWSIVNIDIGRLLSIKDTDAPAKIIGIDIGPRWGQGFNAEIAELKFKSRGIVDSPRYEAEDASLSGGTAINTNHSGYSGYGFVDGYTATGAITTFTVNASSAGCHNVSVRYANATGSTEKLSIYVNGNKIKQTSFSNLANWDTWADKSEILYLNAGDNTIAYKYDSGDSGNVNLDYIMLTNKLEAENASLTGGATVESTNCCFLGTGYVGGYTASGATATFTVNVASAGSYSVVARYANATGSTKTLSIYVNGNNVKQTSFPNLINWDTWKNKSDTITLNAGSNTIAYKYNTGDTGNINLDYIIIKPSASSLIANGDFESGSVNWSLYDFGESWGITSTTKYSGNNSLYITGNDACAAVMSDPIYINGSTNYTVSCYAKGLSHRIYVREYNKYDQQVSEHGSDSVTTDDWQYQSHEFTADSNTVYVRICLYAYGTGTAYFDTVRTDGTDWWTPAWTPVNTSLITNGDFESGTTAKWSLIDAGSGWGVTGSDKYRGSYSLYIDGDGTPAGVEGDPVYINPGTTYTLSCYGKGNHRIYVREYNSSGGLITEHGASTETTVNWAYQTHEFVANANTQYIKISLYTYGGNGQRAYFDDVRVNKGASTPANGSLITNGNFESGTSNWSLLDAGAGWGTTGSDKFSGSNSLYITGNDSCSAVISDPVYVKSAADYVVSCFIKGLNHLIVVKEYNQSDQQIAEHYASMENTANWKYQSHGFTTRSDTLYIRVCLYMYGTGTTYFDYCQVNGDWTPLSGSLVSNGNFESGTSDWSLLDAGAEWGVTNTDKFRDSYSLYIDGDGTPAAVENSSISVSGNTGYIVSCFAKGSHMIYVREYNGSMQFLCEHGPGTETTSDWKYQTHMFITRADTQYIKISLYTYGGSGQRAYFDYVQCKQQ